MILKSSFLDVFTFIDFESIVNVPSLPFKLLYSFPLIETLLQFIILKLKKVHHILVFVDKAFAQGLYQWKKVFKQNIHAQLIKKFRANFK